MVASSGMVVTTLAVEDADARILSVPPTPCALCCRIDYSITGRGGFADIERTRSDGHCAGASAGSHRNVLSHDIARGALEGGLEPIVLATHGVDGEGGVVRDRIMT